MIDNKQTILDLPLDESTNLTGTQYINLRFTYNEWYGYTWGCNTTQHPMNIRPMRDSSHIKHFKSLANAKRNAIKRLLNKL